MVHSKDFTFNTQKFPNWTIVNVGIFRVLLYLISIFKHKICPLLYVTNLFLFHFPFCYWKRENVWKTFTIILLVWICKCKFFDLRHKVVRLENRIKWYESKWFFFLLFSTLSKLVVICFLCLCLSFFLQTKHKHKEKEIEKDAFSDEGPNECRLGKSVDRNMLNL